MTDYDAMLAGGKLDTLVAERVMGLTVQRDNFHAEVWYWIDGIGAREVPHYSTSIAAAWDVVEKVRSLRELFFMSRDEDGLWEVEMCDEYENLQARQAVAASAATAPLAICRAALKAVSR